MGAENVEVILVDPVNDTVVATTTTDSNGDYTFSGLTSNKEFHVYFRYDDGSGSQYHSKSKPFITSP